MVDLKDILGRVQEIAKKHPGYSFHADSGWYTIELVEEMSRKAIGFRFLQGNEGPTIDQVVAEISLDRIEALLEPIVDKYKLGVQGSTRKKTLDNTQPEFESVCRTPIGNEANLVHVLEAFSGFMNRMVSGFFNDEGTISGMGQAVLECPFDDIINQGIGGEYPINVLKAISLAHLCGNNEVAKSYEKGFQSWIEEDREDPTMAHLCDDYLKALKDLQARIKQ